MDFFPFNFEYDYIEYSKFFFGHFVPLGILFLWAFCPFRNNVFWAFYPLGHFVVLGQNDFWAFCLWAFCHTWAFCHFGHFSIESYILIKSITFFIIERLPTLCLFAKNLLICLTKKWRFYPSLHQLSRKKVLLCTPSLMKNE